MRRSGVLLIAVVLFLIASVAVIYSQGVRVNPRTIYDVEWSPDGTYIVAQSQHRSWIYPADNLADYYKVEGQRDILFLYGDKFVGFNSNTYSAWLRTFFLDEEPPRLSYGARIFAQSRIGRNLPPECALPDALLRADYSPVYHLVAMGGVDGSVVTYNADFGNTVSVLRSDPCPTLDVAFSPDGDTLASVHYNGTIQFLKTLDGALIGTFDGGLSQARAVTYNPDGKTLAVLGQMGDAKETVVQVWDVERGELIHQFSGMATAPDVVNRLDGVYTFIEELRYSDDGRWLASADWFGTIFVWDADSGELVHEISNFSTVYFSFSPDGRKLAYGGDEGVLYVYDLEADAVAENLPIPTMTLFPTYTPVPTLTRDPNATATFTVTPSKTPTVTYTPTLKYTYTPEPMLTPFEITCADSPPPLLNVGMRAHVSISEAGETRVNLRVRAEPGGEQIASLEEGAEFYIIGEPVCFDDLTWWHIETLDGAIQGWSAEGFAPDDYFITPDLP